MKLKERSEAPKKPLMQAEPRLPFAVQHQKAPGLESKLKPRPRYEAARYRPAGKLENKVALITGGDSGTGRAVAVLYAREVFLASDADSSYITGIVLEVMGGETT